MPAARSIRSASTAPSSSGPGSLTVPGSSYDCDTVVSHLHFVENLVGHVVAADGRTWEQLPSTDTPGTHQVSAGLKRTGYVQVGVAPPQGSGSDPRNRILLLGTGIAVVIVVAALVLRLRERSRAGPPSRGRRR